MNFKNNTTFSDSAIVFIGNTKMSQYEMNYIHHIFEHFERQQKGYQLLVLQPRLGGISKLLWEWKIAEKLAYYRPDLVVHEQTNRFSIKKFNTLLKLSLGLPNDNSPLITWVDKKTKKRKVIYFERELPRQDVKKAFESISGCELHFWYNKILPSNPENQFPKDSPEYISETRFDKTVQQLNENARNSIKKLRQLKAEQEIVDLILFAIQELDTGNLELPDNMKFILPQVTVSAQSSRLSRLVIDDRYRVWLPDYNNLEIKMGNLPKTLFILFLKHPEGIILKELPDYYNELHKIYRRISNLSNPHKMKIAVNQLVDVTDNSLYVNLSRVKKAFIKKICHEIACHYYITGEKCQPKKIILDRETVQLPAMLISAR